MPTDAISGLQQIPNPLPQSHTHKQHNTLTMVLASFIPSIPAGFTFTRYMVVTSLVSRKALKDPKDRDRLERDNKAVQNINYTYVDVDAGTESAIPNLPITLNKLYVEHEPGTWGPEHEMGLEPGDASFSDIDFFDWDASFSRVIKRLGVKEKEQ